MAEGETEKRRTHGPWHLTAGQREALTVASKCHTEMKGDGGTRAKQRLGKEKATPGPAVGVTASGLGAWVSLGRE